MEKFNLKSVKALMADLQKAVKAVEEKHGVAIKFGNGKIHDTKLELPSCSIMIKTDPSMTTDELLYAENLKSIFPKYVNLIGKEFIYDGCKHKLLGLKTKSANSKFIAKNLYSDDCSLIDKYMIDEKFS